MTIANFKQNISIFDILLNEATKNYLIANGISNLTQKHYDIRLKNNYTYNFSYAVSVNGTDLRLIFNVIPTFRDGQPVPNSTGEKEVYNQYKVEIQFVNASNIGGEDLDELQFLNINAIRTFLKSIFDNCDIKLYSDDPSFYWQGFWEDLDSIGASIYPFKGVHGTGKWRGIHSTWKNKQYNDKLLKNNRLRMTKHITQIILNLDNYIQIIANYLSKHELEEY